MLLRLVITATALSIASIAGNASEVSTEKLQLAILGVVGSDYDAETLGVAVADGLWDESKKAFAIAIPGKDHTRIFAFVIQQSGEFAAVDVSPIEKGLFRKLGLADCSSYERYETVPVEWKPMENERQMLIVRLRAWKEGQRYTVTGPVVIEASGRVIWQ